MENHEDLEALHKNMFSPELRVQLVRTVMPSILSKLISKKFLDTSRDYSRNDLWELAALETTKVVDDVEVSINISNKFHQSAHGAADEGEFEVAIVLIAIVIEHKLNFFYNNILTSLGLSRTQVNQALNSLSLEAKLGWFLLSVSGSKLSSDLHKDIKEVIDLRDSISHYKSTSSSNNQTFSWDGIMHRIDKLFSADMLAIPKRLECELDTITEKRLEWHTVVKKWCKVMFEEEHHDA